MVEDGSDFWVVGSRPSSASLLQSPSGAGGGLWSPRPSQPRLGRKNILGALIGPPLGTL